MNKAHPLIDGQRGVERVTRADGTSQIYVREKIDVEALPRRTAHAVYALLACPDMEQTIGPFSAAEIVLYDDEALSARATGAALREAAKRGLAMNIGGFWTATFLAAEHKRDFETRFLRETGRDGDE